MKYTIKRNDERYLGVASHLPDTILIDCEEQQAKNLAETLTDYFPGCDWLFYVEELEKKMKKPEGKYIVLTNGRYSILKKEPQDLEPWNEMEISLQKITPDTESLTMDCQSPNRRRPMSLIQAKQRAGHIASTELGVRAFIARVEYVAEIATQPVTIKKL